MTGVVATALDTLADLLTTYVDRMRAHARAADDGDYTLTEMDDVESAVTRLGWRLADLDGWLTDRPECPISEYLSARQGVSR